MYSAVQSSIAGRTPLTLLFLFLACTSLVVSQAPGDSVASCRNHGGHPGYEERVNPLMDTHNYPLLLSSTRREGVWQSLNLDENNDEELQTAWTQGGLMCFNRLYVCGFGQGLQNNWLITQHISRQVELDATTVTLQSVDVMIDINLWPECASNPSCIDGLSLYVWETSSPDASSARDTSNYHFVGNLTTSSLDLTLTFMSPHSGFYLGIRDNGTCTGGMSLGGLNRVLVSYKSCPSMTVDSVNSVNVTEAVAGIPGQCVVPVDGGRALISCSNNGVWSVLGDCECDPGYWLSEEIQKCVECPNNSESAETGQRVCPCVQGYYRAPYEGAGVACTQPPSAPRNVTVSELTNTSVVLSWLPPEENGGRNTGEITYSVSYQASSSPQLERAEPTMNNTIVLVTLTPYVSYMFYVTAENHVSPESPGTSRSTASITATTLEGVAAKVTDFRLVSQDVLEWSPPNTPQGVILYYNIKVVHQEKARTITSYNQTSITTVVLLRDWNVTDGLFQVQVQAVTRIGAGEFSDPVNVFVTNESAASVSTMLLISILVPSLFVLTLIIALLILMAYITGRLSKLRQSQTKRKDMKHKIEEYASVKMTDRDFADGGEGGLRPPAVPTSPCPTLPRDKPGDKPGKPSEQGLNEVPASDGTYAILEGPGHHSTTVSDNERLYTPDPTINYLEAVNPVFALADGSERTTEGMSSERNPPPLYWELEGPKESSLMQQREQRGGQVPPAAASGTGDTYWNEGMGPPGSKSFTSPQNTSNISTSTASRSETREPFYLQLTAQNTE